MINAKSLYYYLESTTYFDELQLFAVIFAHWCGLNEKQVNQISDKRTWKRAWEKLDFFIRNPNEDVFNKNITSSPEKCYINKEGIREAILCSGYITVCETGEWYKII